MQGSDGLEHPVVTHSLITSIMNNDVAMPFISIKKSPCPMLHGTTRPPNHIRHVPFPSQPTHPAAILPFKLEISSEAYLKELKKLGNLVDILPWIMTLSYPVN